MRHWRLSAFGLAFAALFFLASLTPSMIPRAPLMQGVLSGLSAAVGYGVGVLAVWFWGRALLLPLPAPGSDRAVRVAFFGLTLLLVLYGLWHAADWQNATRRVMQLEQVGTAHPFTVAAVALIVFALLWGLGSGSVYLARRAGHALARVMPGRTGPVLGVALAIFLIWTLLNGVVLRQIMTMADGLFATIEQTFDEGKDQPTDPMMTGSAESLVTWDELGNRGRDFVARTPDPAEIAAFTGAEALRPLRVYVGRTSAETARGRAELALEELIRQGGFEREILIITTPVGTGWMDPGSHDVVDFIWGGDTAHVAAQYSYLTSVLSIITNVEYGLEQARELFDVIHAYWTTLPEDDRPRLYVHGLSQGALNSQATLPFTDMLTDPIDGAFWAGSPFVSPVWADIRSNRAQGSPAWRPVYGNGSLVRVSNQENTYDQAASPWGPIRMVFLHYGSDPIVNFDIATIWRAPDWLTEAPRAPDVAPEMRWFPFVTAFQTALDMTAALGVEGYGHFYIDDDYIDAWAALTDPPGWSAEQADALRAVFDARPPPW